jgi:hypothetical protein
VALAKEFKMWRTHQEHEHRNQLVDEYTSILTQTIYFWKVT